MKRTLAQLLADAARKAETSQPMQCPHCGELLPDSWRTDDVTSDTENGDDVNDQDEEQPVEWDNRRIDRLNALANSLAAASTNKQR